jgi:hypothetical protein
MENHHHHFRHFRHSDAWHHLVIQCLYQTLENIPQIESLRQQGISLIFEVTVERNLNRVFV